MKKLIAITDLTRMQRGRVCIAGYDAERNCIRPVLPPPGIDEASLIYDGEPILFPFAAAEFDLIRHIPEPPHTEDYRYDPASVQFVRRVADDKRQPVLQWSLFPQVGDIFDQPVRDDNGFYVMDGQGPRSLGTIRPRTIVKVIYEPGVEGAWDYRLHFFDGSNTLYRLKIVDLTWHYYCDSLRTEGASQTEVADELTAMLKQRDRVVYLRIGLSRGWSKFPDRCYLQITAIHTFPDYLSGQTFANLK